MVRLDHLTLPVRQHIRSRDSRKSMRPFPASRRQDKKPNKALNRTLQKRRAG